MCCSVGRAAHNVDGGRLPMVCVVGATDFVIESCTSAGQWQLICYYVSSDYNNVVQSVTLEHDSVRPTYLQAVVDEDCVCGITAKQVAIWYHSVCYTGEWFYSAIAQYT